MNFAPRFAELLLIACLLALSGCRSLPPNLSDKLQPSNERNWIAEQQVLPAAEITGSQYRLKNIRNCNYVTNDDYVVAHYDRTIDLSEIQTVDFVVVPFKVRQLAHTMLSFGLRDGSYLCVSVEVRKEAGERYNAMLGLGRQFELMYVLADEKDLIRVRTRHRDAEVYVYPSVASPSHAQALFADVIARVNKLAVEPEFYHSIKNNCTTNLAAHVNQVSSKKIKYGWKVLLPGFSAEYAYQLGLLDNSIPFDELTELALVNDLAEQNYDAPDFSKRIRAKHGRVKRYAELTERLESRYGQTKTR